MFPLRKYICKPYQRPIPVTESKQLSLLKNSRGFLPSFDYVQTKLRIYISRACIITILKTDKNFIVIFLFA